MDLLSNLNSSNWQNSEPNDVSGLKAYNIVRTRMVKPGLFEYIVREDTEDASSEQVTLENASGKFNPLQSVRNAELKIQDGKITAVNLEGDCVIRK